MAVATKIRARHRTAMDLALVKSILLSALPALIAGLGVFGSLWWRRNDNPDATPIDVRDARARSRRSRDAIVLALFALVPLASHRLITGAWPNLSFHRAGDWMPWLGLATLVPGALALLAGGRSGHMSTRAWFVAACGAALFLFLATFGPSWRLLQGTWSAADAAINLGVPIALALVFSLGMARLSLVPGPAGVLAQGIALFGASQIVVIDFDSLSMAQWIGAAAAFLAPAGLLALVRPSLSVGVAPALAIALFASCATFQGATFGSPSHAAILGALLAITPWMGALAVRSIRRGERPSAGALLSHLALTALPVIIAMSIALAAMARAEQDGYDY